MAVASTKGSWFNDTTTSSGKSAASTVGIAVGSPSVSGGLDLGPGIGGLATLNGWFLVKDPGGKLHIFQQIDTGPAGFTGRGIDYSQPALSHLAGGDPTDQTSQLVYLGKTSGQIASNLASAVQQLGGDPTKILKGISPTVWADGAIHQGYADLANAPQAINSNPNAAIAGSIGVGAGAAAAVGQGVIDAGSVLADVWNFITTPAKWLIILKFIAGVTAIYLAIKGLAGIDSSPVVSTVEKAAVVAPK